MSLEHKPVSEKLDELSNPYKDPFNKKNFIEQSGVKYRFNKSCIIGINETRNSYFESINKI